MDVKVLDFLKHPLEVRLINIDDAVIERRRKTIGKRVTILKLDRLTKLVVGLLFKNVGNLETSDDAPRQVVEIDSGPICRSGKMHFFSEELPNLLFSIIL